MVADSCLPCSSPTGEPRGPEVSQPLSGLDCGSGCGSGSLPAPALDSGRAIPESSLVARLVPGPAWWGEWRQEGDTDLDNRGSRGSFRI